MLKELGQYKEKLSSIFHTDDKICRLLLGENYEDEDYDIDKELEKYIVPHLYIDKTITDTKSYIMFETYSTRTNPSIKGMKIVVQVICHKDISKYKEKPKGYYGLRYDVLSQYVEELLCPQDKELTKKRIKQFGIGSLELQPVDLFLTDKYIGRTLTFNVPDFR